VEVTEDLFDCRLHKNNYKKSKDTADTVIRMTGYTGPIEQQTLDNEDFRRVIFTGKHEQLVVMCLQPGEEIGDEVHPMTDQFFRVEEGEATIVIDGEKSIIGDGEAAIVPGGAKHNVINNGSVPLKLYTIYAPPNHPDGTVHKTKAEADAAEHGH
jgi:mannose-6-phosphate isomerase-like protein (cupin superfamily)